MNVLYLSYDGMTDPLGQSQVIPYLRELTRMGHRFTLISFEKPDRFKKNRDYVAGLMSSADIAWHPLIYTKFPPVLSTLYDKHRMQQLAFNLYKTNKFEAVHCRSYIAALVGQQLKKRLGLKFIFDMRGFWADERVDGGLWKLNNPVYKTVYRYFKRKEKEFLQEADYTITLTEAARDEMSRWALCKPIKNLAVIPCCADLDLFTGEGISDADKVALRHELGIAEGAFVLSYLGSIGTWYMPGEMMDFFKQLLTQRPDACFLFITTEPRDYLLKLADERGISAQKIIVTQTPHNRVPLYLSLSNWSIFFIKPVFSKLASSATKQGEIMGMGIPHVCNAGVGDIPYILQGNRLGIVIDEFTADAYCRTINDMLCKTVDKKAIIAKADEIYSLKKGVAKYAAVYNVLANL